MLFRAASLWLAWFRMIHCSGASQRLAVPVASVGVMLRGKDRLASIGAADRPVAALIRFTRRFHPDVPAPFRFP